MARLLSGTTSQFLNVSTGEAIPYPLTFSARVRPTATSNGLPVVYGEAYPGWDAEYTGVVPSGFGLNFGKGATFGGTSIAIPPVAGRWYLVVWVFNSDVERHIYLDGSSQTNSDTAFAPFVGHANRNFTLGGVLLSAGSLHTPAAYDGDVADVALWNTALTAADVDALAASRPGSVKAGNLKAWYKLGANGDLSSSVGSYPSMTVFGTVPVSADPTYPATAPLLSTKPLYIPDHLRDDAELDLNHPLLRDCGGFFPLHPNRPFENPLRRDVPVYRNAWGTQQILGSGSENSSRFPYGPKISVDAALQPAIIGYPWSVTLGAWIKLHTAAGAGYGAFHGIIGGDVQVFLDPADSPAPRLVVEPGGAVGIFSNRSIASYGVFSGPEVPVNKWTHIVACFESIFHGVRYPNAFIWVNGKLVVSSINNAGLGSTETWTNIFPISLGSVTWYTDYPGHELIFNGEMRDAFYYRRKLSDAEVRWLYEQPEDLYRKRTPRVYFFAPTVARLARAQAQARAKRILPSPGVIVQSFRAARVSAFVKGVTHAPSGVTLGNISRAPAPAKAKGIAPHGGLISTAFSKVSGAAISKGVYFLLPPILSAWGAAKRVAKAAGVTTTPGTAVGNISRAPAPAKAKGVLPQGGIISQALARVMGNARVSGLLGVIRDYTFHGSLTRMGATAPWASIERERRTLLGADSRLELLTLSGHEWETEIELLSHWVARRARFLGNSDEWLLEVPESSIGSFPRVQDLAGARIYTHGQTLTFRIIQTNRPLKAGHVWEFQLEAIGDAV